MAACTVKTNVVTKNMDSDQMCDIYGWLNGWLTHSKDRNVVTKNMLFQLNVGHKLLL